MDILTPEIVPGLIAKGGSTRVDVEIKPRFKPGDEILTRNINPTGHTRLPRYLRSKRGVVERDHGVFIFPDTHAHGQGAKPQHVYSVRFMNTELWGAQASPKDSCNVDVFDDYMDPA
jgi:nitrile hydratase